ncbi:LegC family aminotransferase [Rhodothermus sp. AH-315-K08]|nr:LegC family aminotransferase [Rhodothermus sp. AH-315-K08]
MIPLCVPVIEGNEWTYVKDCLDTGWVSSAGTYVTLFEERMAEYTGVRFAVACVNGTSALQISLKLAGVRPDDEVIVPTISFIAPINAIHYNGARPVFMDTDEFYTLDTRKTIRFISEETTFRDGATYNRITGRRISALIVVHVFGNAVDLEDLIPLCDERGIVVVEDGAESLGTQYKTGRYKGRHAGSQGALGCLSFNGNKIITTGGGGMILTDDEDLASRAKYLTQQAKDDETYFVHNEVGYNFRLTNIQAALGVGQLEMLDSYLERKRSAYERYVELAAEIPGIEIAGVPAFARSNHWMTVASIDPAVFPLSRDELLDKLDQRSIQTRPIWHLNHLQRPYALCQHYEIDSAPGSVANSLTLPSSANITEQEIASVAEAIADV